MQISSRTPDGIPNSCPVCGGNVRANPSPITQDAPCPICGHLLWFYQPVPKSKPARQPENGICRRWFIALSLGLILGCSAAVGVWYSVPETYTAFAELTLPPGENFFYSSRETRVNLTTYRQTMSRLAK